MSNTNHIQEGKQSDFQSIKNIVSEDELLSTIQEETQMANYPHGQEIDLNELFPGAETDLNILFPDTEIKYLLKSIIKNKKDMSTIKERLSTENETPDKNKKANITSYPSESENAKSG